jgi:SAM-dependent methyltransferase
MATFRCNICDAENDWDGGVLRRDDPSCARCGSTVRLRALVYAFSMELLGAPLSLPEFPVLKSVRGLGMSDSRECAALLAEKFDYRNTFYHEEPRLDIAQPVNEREAYDFVLSGDVFEHVAPPADRAFANVAALLKPNGFLAMTVPYSTDATTREHYPELHQYRVVAAGGHLALVNRTRAGEWQVFDNLVFHGGAGATLELRLFSETDLRRDLAAGGFRRTRFATEDYAPFGILHEGAWGVPVIAGNEPYRLARESIAEMMPEYARRMEHIRKVEAERVRLEALCRELNELLEKTDARLEAGGRWGQSLEEDLRRARDEVARLQKCEAELRTSGERLHWELSRSQAEIEERTQWALRLQAEVEERTAELARRAEELDLLRRRVGAWEASRWVNLGRALGLGPKGL